jgi:hypothetical protein
MEHDWHMTNKSQPTIGWVVAGIAKNANLHAHAEENSDYKVVVAATRYGITKLGYLVESTSAASPTAVGTNALQR